MHMWYVANSSVDAVSVVLITASGSVLIPFLTVYRPVGSFCNITTGQGWAGIQLRRNLGQPHQGYLWLVLSPFHGHTHCNILDILHEQLFTGDKGSVILNHLSSREAYSSIRTNNFHCYLFKIFILSFIKPLLKQYF